jgi:hypothetical protein
MTVTGFCPMALIANGEMKPVAGRIFGDPANQNSPEIGHCL